MSEGNGASRNTRTILQTALGELNDRKDRLQPFIDEVREVDHAIRTLEKALNPAAPKGARKAAVGGNGAGGTQRERVVALLKESLDPLASGQISEATGIARGSTFTVLSKMVADGELVKIDGKFGLPVPELEPVAPL